jgi:hypothetical protein
MPDLAWKFVKRHYLFPSLAEQMLVHHKEKKTKKTQIIAPP